MNDGRTRRRLCLSLALAVSAISGSTQATVAAEAGPVKISGLLHNEDCTNFFGFQDFPAGKAGEIVDRYVDVLAGAGVTVLMCNTNARRTNYRSDVPNGPDEQPFLAAVPPARRAGYRKLIGNMMETARPASPPRGYRPRGHGSRGGLPSSAAGPRNRACVHPSARPETTCRLAGRGDDRGRRGPAPEHFGQRGCR